MKLAAGVGGSTELWAKNARSRANCQDCPRPYVIRHSHHPPLPSSGPRKGRRSKRLRRYAGTASPCVHRELHPSPSCASPLRAPFKPSFNIGRRQRGRVALPRAAASAACLSPAALSSPLQPTPTAVSVLRTLLCTLPRLIFAVRFCRCLLFARFIWPESRSQTLDTPGT